jgi:hypothetical protein
MGLYYVLEVNFRQEPDQTDLDRWKSAGDGVWEGRDGLSFKFHSFSRYFGFGYERGNWPSIARLLLDLLGHSNVERVGYRSDMGEPADQVTPDFLSDLNKLWITAQQKKHEPKD